MHVHVTLHISIRGQSFVHEMLQKLRMMDNDMRREQTVTADTRTGARVQHTNGHLKIVEQDLGDLPEIQLNFAKQRMTLTC